MEQQLLLLLLLPIFVPRIGWAGCSSRCSVVRSGVEADNAVVMGRFTTLLWLTEGANAASCAASVTRRCSGASTPAAHWALRVAKDTSSGVVGPSSLLMMLLQLLPLEPLLLLRLRLSRRDPHSVGDDE